MATKKLIEIPFDQHGNLMHYGYHAAGDYSVENFEFEDTLKFQGFTRGRSAAYATFTRSKGETYGVFLSDLTDMIPHLRDGTITGRFTFCKRGQNYGCRLIEPKIASA